MKFVFETGKEVICYDEAIAKILRQDRRYKEVTTKKVDNEETNEKGKKNTKKSTKKVTTEEVENTEKVEEKGETDAKIQK